MGAAVKLFFTWKGIFNGTYIDQDWKASSTELPRPPRTFEEIVVCYEDSFVWPMSRFVSYLWDF